MRCVGSLMARAPPRKRCSGCNALKATGALYHGPQGAKCCHGCYKASRREGAGLPEWRACAGCPAGHTGPKRCFSETPATPADSESDSEFSDSADSADSDAAEWRCADCRRVSALATGSVTKTRVGATGPMIVELIATHRAQWVFVDFWILALTPECELILSRLIFWLRFGVLAGLLPTVACASWTHNVRVLDVVVLATHIHALFQDGRWPAGNAPVLVTGARQHDFDALGGLLAARGMPAAQRARLRPVPFTLSERMATAGFELRAFVRSPALAKWKRVLILKRAHLAHVLAGAPGAGGRELSEQSPQGAAFRSMLYPPLRAA